MRGLAIIGLLALLIVAAGCSNQSGKEYYTNITAEELQSLIQKEDVFLVDTHIPEQQHIRGTDVVIPFNEIQDNLDKLPKDKKIVLYCRSDSMSTQASQALAELGYTNVYNLIGGTNNWRDEGYEFE